MDAETTADGGWAARLEFRQLPDDAGDLERRIHELNKRQLPGPGWSAIVDKLHRDLLALDPGYTLIQVKEKFGYLRVYVRTQPDVQELADHLCGDAARKSAVTCEGCGDPGQLRDQRAWRLTLCELCDLYHPDGRPLPNEWPEFDD